jgi:hypothetical protein
MATVRKPHCHPLVGVKRTIEADSEEMGPVSKKMRTDEFNLADQSVGLVYLIGQPHQKKN